MSTAILSRITALGYVPPFVAKSTMVMDAADILVLGTGNAEAATLLADALNEACREEAGDGVSLIAAERARQVSAEGWTANHDDSHTQGEMADAAVCYAEAAVLQIGGAGPWAKIPHSTIQSTPEFWPWAYEWWKPSEDPVRNLVKAGALIAAEIDRLKRLPQPPTTQPKEERR